ncbi:MAG: hypothetical protein G5663_06820 [Serratia symbiotica]|nr:hypothetical protein [Serratia symbiotica]
MMMKASRIALKAAQYAAFMTGAKNAWAACCFADCQRIVYIVFLVSDKRFYILARDSITLYPIELSVTLQK